MRLIVVSMITAPPWGQLAWPSYPNHNAISVTSGDVGIGTPSPQAYLDSTGMIRITGIGNVPTSGGNGLELFSAGFGGYIQAYNRNTSSYINLVLEGNNVLLNPVGTGNVGIGTTNPDTALDVNGGISVEGSILYLRAPSDTYHHIRYGAIGGLSDSDGLVFNSNFVIAKGPDGEESAKFVVQANGNVGIGTTSPTDALDVNGTIAATEVKVESSVPDYVFDADYRLQPLSEVKQFVEEHHHLPDIPSAAEVKEKGLSLGDMQAKLLGKVEELTLHMIQAEERNNWLEERNDLLEKQVRGLQERLTQLAGASGNTATK